MFAAVVAVIRFLAERVDQAMCGVRIMFFAVSSGLSSRIGSIDATSLAAPAI